MSDSQNDSRSSSEKSSEELIEKITWDYVSAWKKLKDGDAAPEIEDFLDAFPESQKKLVREKLAEVASSFGKSFDHDGSSSSESNSENAANAETFIGSEDTGATISYSDQGEDSDDFDYKLNSGQKPSLPGYEILDELGRGGMGVVYRARQTDLNRMVALKMVLSGDHSSSEELLRFGDEAEAVAQMQHPNIVQIYEIGESSGLPYFSLEYIDGGTLSQACGDKPLEMKRAAELVELLARAMEYAHQRDIIHRDLKPANVLMTLDGMPKIADFGLAKRLDIDSSRTRTGTIVGTPKYMSPEQAQGSKDVGPLSDVYSLGAILYELLTGRAPFLAATPMETVMQVLHQEPVPPSRLRSKLSKDLETICLKCLQKSPEKRYTSAELLAEDLRRFQAEEPIVARPVSDTERFWRWCKRKPVVASLSAISLILLLTVAIGSPIAAYHIAGERDRADQNAEKEKRERERADINAENEKKQREIAEKQTELANRRQNQTVDALRTLVFGVQGQLKNRPSMQQLKTSLLKSAIDKLKVITSSDKKSSKPDIALGGAHRRLGEIYLEIGNAETALQHFQQCFEIVQALHQEEKLPNVEQNFSTILDFIGDAHLRAGDSKKARESYIQALNYRKQWLVNNPGDQRLEFWVPVAHISQSHARLGELDTLEGNPRQALDHFIALRDVRQRWMDKYPKSADARQKLAGALQSLGSSYQRIGAFQKALLSYKNSVSLFEGFINENETINTHRWNLAVTLDKMAGLLIWMDDPAASEETYLRVVQLFERVVQLDPLNANARRALALAYSGLGITYSHLNDAQSEEFHGKALVLQLKLFEEYEKAGSVEARGRAELMHAYARSGDHERASAIARKLEPEYAQDSRILIHVSSCFALCASAVSKGKQEDALTGEERQQRQSYADHAVKILSQAVERGYHGIADIENDPDLESIRDRADFREILNTLKNRLKATESE